MADVRQVILSDPPRDLCDIARSACPGVTIHRLSAACRKEVSCMRLALHRPSAARRSPQRGSNGYLRMRIETLGAWPRPIFHRLRCWTRPSRHRHPPGYAAATVTFSPARAPPGTSHPLARPMIVTAGRGLAQSWAGSRARSAPATRLWFPPGEKHWQWRPPETGMTHIAIQEALDGKAVDWLEHVREQYRGG